MKKHLKTLELDKVLALLAERVTIDQAKIQVEAIEPDFHFDTAEKLIRQTSDAMALALRFGAPKFENLHDPELYIKRCAAGGSLNNPELLHIARILRSARVLLDWKALSTGTETSLGEMFGALAVRRQLENRIFAVILSEDTIADDASETLFNIRRKIRSLENQTRERLDQLIRSSANQRYLQDSIVTIRDGRFVVPVKAEYKNEIPGLVHDTSASGATLFIEPVAAVESGNEVRMLQAQEKIEIERILAELSAACADCSDDILTDYTVILNLNIIFAKADLAIDMKANTPKLMESGYLSLTKARHPLIPKDKVVPISVSLGEKYNRLIITGPNTGGKTVTLKTIGLLTAMALCGLLIPASEGSVIPVYDRILVDIGDEQSIEQSLSTFSAHMKNIIYILRHATNHSLVLLDELGSGTDPIEGAALATAILDEFGKACCHLAATTHYAELKMYALETEGVENASCEFDVKTLMPTYRLLIGTPGRSNAFAISKRLGLPQEIIFAAENYVSTENTRFENIISSLEQSRQKYESAESKLSEESGRIRQTQSELEQKQKQADLDAERIISQAHEKAQSIVDSVRASSEQLMDELLELKKQKEKEEFSKNTSKARSELKGKISKLYDAANPIVAKTQHDYVLPRELKKGDSVLIFDIDKKGVVLEEKDSSGNVLVQSGILKTRVPVTNLRLLGEKLITFTGKAPKTSRNVVSKTERSVSSEIDLRGKTVEEALLDIDMFIDHAILNHINQLSIIHGKGTGALRKAVQQHLKSLPQVRSYRLGVYGEGEAGVTIVELK